MKILIAEDDAGILTFTEFILKQDGHTVFTAQNGVEALKILETTIPDILLSDIEMPGMNGMDLLKKVNADARLQSMIKVFLTSKIDREHIAKGVALDVDDYITKPFSPTELRKRLASILQNRKG